MDGHFFVVGQDQYPSMGRFRKPPFATMGVPDPPGGETRERSLILCSTKRGTKLAHTNKDKTECMCIRVESTCKLNNQLNVVQSNCTLKKG